MAVRGHQATFEFQVPSTAQGMLRLQDFLWCNAFGCSRRLSGPPCRGGLIVLQLWPSVLGMVLSVYGQLWRIDRLGMFCDAVRGRGSSVAGDAVAILRRRVARITRGDVAPNVGVGRLPGLDCARTEALTFKLSGVDRQRGGAYG